MKLRRRKQLANEKQLLKHNPSRAIDLIIQQCNDYGLKPWFSEFKIRNRKKTDPLPDDNQILRHCVVAIAFSQGTQSRLIAELVETLEFSKAFQHFNIKALARKEPEKLLESHWQDLSIMRFRSKIDRIIKCAQTLEVLIEEHQTFSQYLKGFSIPRRIVNKTQLNRFWAGFDKLQQDLRTRNMPFFQSTTSLLQLLLDLDFDSVKPDLIVMRLARRLGIINRETGDLQLRTVAKTIQELAIEKQIRAPAIDLALLAFGNQTRAQASINTNFCPSKDPCSHTHCLVGRGRLCEAYTDFN